MSYSAYFHLADQLEIDCGTEILEELTGQSLTRKGQPVRLFDQTAKTAEAYFPADERGKPYVQNFQQGKRWYPITAWMETFETDWKTAVQDLSQRYLGEGASTNKQHRQPKFAIGSRLEPPTSYHDSAIVASTLGRYEDNYFTKWLFRVLGRPIAYELIHRFRVGTWLADYGVSSHWKHTTVFWQIDEQQRVHAGKIMYYLPATGRRMKETNSSLSIPAWAHKLLSLNDFNCKQCLFGLHQLAEQPVSKPIAIVESEKTAIIATAFEPGFIWLATGGLGNLQVDKFRPLVGRSIVLYPDLTYYKSWCTKAEELNRQGIRVYVSRLLEEVAPQTDRYWGSDIADYMTRNRCPKTGRALNEVEGYPALWDCPTLNSTPMIQAKSLDQYLGT